MDTVKIHGIELLAWYEPFHLSENWGIYYRKNGIGVIALAYLEFLEENISFLPSFEISFRELIE